jgi:DNA-binding GntR family transcriptional regulator
MSSSRAQIAEHLRQRIRTGALRPGDNTPSLNELMRTWGTTRPTAQAAVDMLRREGLVLTRRGGKTVVAPRRRIVTGTLHFTAPVGSTVVGVRPLVTEATGGRVVVPVDVELADQA